MKTQRIAFVCLHGSAKSLIAAEYFNQLARNKGLSARATTSDPEPDPEVPANVVEGMKSRGYKDMHGSHREAEGEEGPEEQEGRVLVGKDATVWIVTPDRAQQGGLVTVTIGAP